MCVFAHINEMTFGPHLWMEGRLSGEQTMIRGLKLSVPTSSWEGEGAEAESVTNDQSFSHSHLFNETFIKTQKQGSDELPRGRSRHNYMPAPSSSGTELLQSGPHSMHLFLWLFIHIL